jgi:hypothetical protein
MAITVLLLALAWLTAGLNFRYFCQRQKGQRVSMLPLVTQILVLLAWLIHSLFALTSVSPWLFVGTAFADVSLWHYLRISWRHFAERS